MNEIRAPGACVRQVTGNGPEGRPILSVLFKQTFRLFPDASIAPAPDAVPLVEQATSVPDDPHRLESDTDLFPLKPLTDVIVKGAAHNHPGKAYFVAGVRVVGQKVDIRVCGERRCTVSARGKVVFAEPKITRTVPLTFDRAYGGRDSVCEAKYGNPFKRLESYTAPEAPDLTDASPYLYPRNLAGRGYLIEPTPQAVEQIKLPELEDPEFLLTPDNIARHDPDRWALGPMPMATEWFDYPWFPRIAFAGMMPLHVLDPADIAAVPEIARGFCPAAAFANEGIDFGDPRVVNGAAPALQVPLMRGGEEIELINIHPARSSFVFRLPTSRPRLWIDGRNGSLKSTEPVLHTVVIEPEINRLQLLWRGCAAALRPYLPEELEKMPLRVLW